MTMLADHCRWGVGMDVDRDEALRLYREILRAEPRSEYYAKAAREQLADLEASLI